MASEVLFIFSSIVYKIYATHCKKLLKKNYNFNYFTVTTRTRSI